MVIDMSQSASESAKILETRLPLKKNLIKEAVEVILAGVAASTSGRLQQNSATGLWSYFFGEEKMKKFLIAGSSLAAVAAAGSAGAVDVTLGGSIAMEMEYGVGKGVNGFAFDAGSASNSISLSLAAAGTTDAGIKYGGSFSIADNGEMKLDLYPGKKLFKFTVPEKSQLTGKVYNVSGGKSVTANQIVSVKINSSWQGVGGTRTGYGVTQMLSGDVGGGFDAEAICKIAGRFTTALVGSITGNNDIGDDDVISGNFTNELSASARDADNELIIAPNEDTAHLPEGRMTDSARAAIEHLNSADSQNLAIGLDGGNISFLDGNDVENGAEAEVFIAHEMQVKLVSSNTKTVVGRVCISGIEASETAAYHRQQACPAGYDAGNLPGSHGQRHPHGAHLSGLHRYQYAETACWPR